MLKSRWLEGKQNHQVDHLIHTLVTMLLPSYTIHHIHQELGFEGLNLANKQCKELLMQTPEMNTTCVHDLGDNKFTVQSVTNPSQIYAVNLSTQPCNCPDWPRVQLCKHVTTVVHFFRDGDLQIALKAALPIQEGSAGPWATETTTSILENVIAISKALLNHGKLSSHETTQSLQMVELHLTAIAHCSHPSESPLPDKEDIPPNESTRMKTAKQMGAKQQWRKPHPATTSPLEPLAMHQIGELIHKKAPVKITDPCSSGVSSSQDALPDAQTMAQNTEACAAAANGMVLPQPQKCGCKCAGTSALSTECARKQVRKFHVAERGIIVG